LPGGRGNPDIVPSPETEKITTIPPGKNRVEGQVNLNYYYSFKNIRLLLHQGKQGSPEYHKKNTIEYGRKCQTDEKRPAKQAPGKFPGYFYFDFGFIVVYSLSPYIYEY
jgi:hypothetical protein